MARVLYRPDPEHDCPPETVQYGYAFGASPVEVSDEKHLRKFAGNRFFEVLGEAGHDPLPVDPAPAPDEPAGPLGEMIPPADPVDPPADLPARTLKAVHRGRGSWSIMDGDVEVKEGLSKADAEAFNSWSDADKEAFVA
jgi:hypothetical protein